MSNPEQPPVGQHTQERQRWLHERSSGDTSDLTWRQGMFRGSSVPSVHATGWDQRHWSSRWLYRVGEGSAHSLAGVIAAALVLVWTIVGIVVGFADWWQTVLYSVTGCVTFIMVFVIQHTQERQTAAIQRKLDELVRVAEDADDTLIAVEEAPDEHLQALAHLNVADREHAAGSIVADDNQ